MAMAIRGYQFLLAFRLGKFAGWEAFLRWARLFHALPLEGTKTYKSSPRHPGNSQAGNVLVDAAPGSSVPSALAAFRAGASGLPTAPNNFCDKDVCT
jgi:hypothetical protein